MWLPRPVLWMRWALLETSSELPARSRTRLLQGAGEAFFFYSSLMTCSVNLVEDQSETLGRDDTNGNVPCSTHDPPEQSNTAIACLLRTYGHDAINHTTVYRSNNFTTYDRLGMNAATFPTAHNRPSRHKETFIMCCAVSCDKVFFRKDHLTQHIRNKHQRLDTKFHCPNAGCANRSFSLDELFEHMKQASHKKDVRFTSIKNAAEKSKCACGDGLIISGRCKACGYHLD
jgi:hypothetical protein